VGIIDHSTGTRDIRKLAHLGKAAPFLAVIAIMAAASMGGLPVFFGFVAKEAALESELVAEVLPEWARIATTAGIVVGSILTLAYSIRFIWGAFGRKQLKRPSPAVQNLH
ncbi:proton-conducting transporter transmembrane domain-containing protein, partial [Weissella cibaria]|uniref:proton-conducting transporter transmembrane domain-containing protein n=1 Tax=Weissella cibaria TaxID=137591 RepID=UPI0028114967